MGGYHPIHRGPEQNKKGERHWICSFCWSQTTHLLLLTDMGAPCSWDAGLRRGHPLSLTSQVFRFGLGLHHWLSWASSLQMEIVGLFSNHKWCEPISHNKPISRYPCVSYQFCFFLENPEKYSPEKVVCIPRPEKQSVLTRLRGRVREESKEIQ